MSEKGLQPLTDKQKHFCQEYIYDWNATRAAIAAGYSEKTAKEQASRLLTNVNVQAYVEEVQKDIEKQCGISRQRVLDEYMKIAFNSIAHLHNTWIDRKEFESLTEDQKACISEIDTKIITRTIDKELVNVEQIKIKLYDKNKALENISKMMGYDAPIKIIQSSQISLKIMSDEQDL